MRKLDTVIVEDLYLNKTASFWERPDSPEGAISRPWVDELIAKGKVTKKEIESAS